MTKKKNNTYNKDSSFENVKDEVLDQLLEVLMLEKPETRQEKIEAIEKALGNSPNLSLSVF